MVSPSGGSRLLWLLVPAGLCVACQASKTLRLLPESDDGEATTKSERSAGSGAPASDGEDAGAHGGGEARSQPQGSGGASGAAGMGGGAGAAQPLVGGLLHRYSFSGIGTTVIDSAGSPPAHGVVNGGATLDGSGTLTLDGIDDYVALPGGLVSSLTSVTMVAWFTWHSQRSWERVFDFGATAEGGDQPGTSVGHLFFTPRIEPNGVSSANLFVEGMAEMTGSNSTAEFPTEQEQYVAVVFNGDQRTLEAYVEGSASSLERVAVALSDVPDEHCWLGQSQWSHDQHMYGTYNEFRIYGTALSNTQVRELLAAGPDQP